jgi:hypothetical protein
LTGEGKQRGWLVINATIGGPLCTVEIGVKIGVNFGLRVVLPDDPSRK